MISGVNFRGRGQAELDWQNVDTVLLWGINIQASLKVIFSSTHFMMMIDHKIVLLTGINIEASFKVYIFGRLRMITQYGNTIILGDFHRVLPLGCPLNRFQLFIADDSGASEEIQSGQQHNQPPTSSRCHACPRPHLRPLYLLWLDR